MAKPALPQALLRHQHRKPGETFLLYGFALLRAPRAPRCTRRPFGAMDHLGTQPRDRVPPRDHLQHPPRRQDRRSLRPAATAANNDNKRRFDAKRVALATISWVVFRSVVALPVRPEV